MIKLCPQIRKGNPLTREKEEGVLNSKKKKVQTEEKFGKWVKWLVKRSSAYLNRKGQEKVGKEELSWRREIIKLAFVFCERGKKEQMRAFRFNKLSFIRM